MPLHIIRNDITKVKCDAIVNAAKSTLLGGGGVDGAIHRAAGPRLLEECRSLGGCLPGQAKITHGYNLPSKYVIHTVGPKWAGGGIGEQKILECCYHNSLNLAIQYGCESIAFPLIASGTYGYPKEKALKIAVGVIERFLENYDLTIYIVIFDSSSLAISEKLFGDVKAYIDDNYIGVEYYNRPIERDFSTSNESQPLRDAQYESVSLHSDISDKTSPEKDKRLIPPPPFDSLYTMPAPMTGRDIRPSAPAPAKQASMPAPKTSIPPSLNDMISKIDESFSQMLLRKIDEKGMTDAECYRKANVDRKLFSKIRNDINYHPKKTTAIAFSIALGLDLNETNELLSKAGYTLSHSNKFDIIIEYFLLNKNYNIFEINETLFSFDQVLLGV